MKTGIELITDERRRQVEVEGWTPEHDADHKRGELAIAGACYAAYHTDAMVVTGGFRDQDSAWPWADDWWKPSNDPIHNLVKAGALIAAEIDRLQAASPTGAGKEEE